jgi:hypothetical protein
VGTQSDKRRANGVPMCEGTNRGGKPCGNTAGFRTRHPGFGNCTFHGGSTPSGESHAARLQAQAEAGRLGAEVPIDPGDALALAVRLVGGEVEWLRRELRKAEEDADADPRVLAGTFSAAVERLARVSKLAADAGIDERRLELDSLVIDRLGAAVTAAITDAALDEDSRARLDAALRTRLGELRDDDLRPRPVELTA